MIVRVVLICLLEIDRSDYIHKGVSFAHKRKKTRKLNFMSGIILAMALSIDSVAVGMGAGLLEGVRWMLIAGAFLFGIFMMEIGWKLGKCCAKFYKKDLSWIGGICLLLLAFFAF